MRRGEDETCVREFVQNEKKPPGPRPEGGRRAPREGSRCASVANAPAWPAREPPPSLSVRSSARESRFANSFARTRALVSLFAATATEPALAGSPLAGFGARPRGRRGKSTLASARSNSGVSRDEDASRGRVSRRTKRCAFHRSTGRVSPSPIPRSRIVRALRTADISRQRHAVLACSAHPFHSAPPLVSSRASIGG